MDLKVVSYNIRFIDDPDGHSIKERAQRLNKIIQPYNPDIIGFQEYTPKWEEYITEYFGHEYEIFNKYRSDPEGTPILWKKNKFRCLDKGYFWYSDTPEIESKGWDQRCDCYRICLYVVLKEIDTGKTIKYLNTHFGFGDRGQTLSAGLLYDYCTRTGNFPTIVTGDFNMIPDSPGYREMTKHFTDVNKVTTDYRGDTYHGYHPEEDHNEHIDYCFISSGVIPEAFKILDETVDGKFASDHWGLFAELKI